MQSQSWFPRGVLPCAGLLSRLAPIQSFLGVARQFHASPACLARKVFTGIVVSDRPQKSVVVAVERMYRHPKYDKLIRKRSKFMAHDEIDEFKIGDKVRIEEHRPLSRHKNWVVLGHADRALEEAARPAREAKLAEAAAAKEAARIAREAKAAASSPSPAAAASATAPA